MIDIHREFGHRILLLNNPPGIICQLVFVPQKILLAKGCRRMVEGFYSAMLRRILSATSSAMADISE
jgi:hypothetical protein